VLSRKLLPPLLAALALGVAACSSSPSASPTAHRSATTTSPTSGGLPSVSNPTDLTKEPLPSAGPSPAPTSLVTKDLVVGTGATATANSSVTVQYVGANYANGKVFDSSWSRGQSATFSLNQVIPGFSQAIEGMKVGGRRLVVIPPRLGYGAQGSPPAVGRNETLIFVIDLLAVQ
jgi:peptidylprolyl isomerase